MSDKDKPHRIIEAGKNTRFSSSNQPTKRGRGKTLATILKEKADEEFLGITIRFKNAKGDIEEKAIDIDLNGVTVKEAIAVVLLKKAIDGDMKAIEKVESMLGSDAGTGESIDYAEREKILQRRIEEAIIIQEDNKER